MKHFLSPVCAFRSCTLSIALPAFHLFWKQLCHDFFHFLTLLFPLVHATAIIRHAICCQQKTAVFHKLLQSLCSLQRKPFTADQKNHFIYIFTDFQSIFHSSKAGQCFIIYIIKAVPFSCDPVWHAPLEVLLKTHSHMQICNRCLRPDIPLGQINSHIISHITLSEYSRHSLNIIPHLLIAVPCRIGVVQIRGCIKSPARYPGFFWRIGIAMVHNSIHTIQENGICSSLHILIIYKKTWHPKPGKGLVGHNFPPVNMSCGGGKTPLNGIHMELVLGAKGFSLRNVCQSICLQNISPGSMCLDTGFHLMILTPAGKTFKEIFQSKLGHSEIIIIADALCNLPHFPYKPV